MPATLSAAQKAFFIQEAESSLNDLCDIDLTSSSSQDSLGQVQYNRTTVNDVPCGISFSSLAYKNEINQSVVLTADAILRLKKSQTLSVNDLVTCRGKEFTVDGIYEGLTLKIVALKYMKEDE